MRLTDEQFAYLLIVPLIIFSLVFIAYPLGYSFWTTFGDVDYHRAGDVFIFTGLDQWKAALFDPRFANSVLVSLEFTATSVSFATLISVGLALLLNEPLKGRGILRALVIVPWAVPEFATAILWKFLYDSDIGFFNGVFYSLGLISSYVGFMTKETAIPLLSIAYSWHMAPLGAFFLLSSIQFISSEEYRAAKIDGAGPFRRFWHVTLPHMRYSLLIVLILTTVEAMRAFDIIYVMTGGGPALASDTLTNLAFLRTFVDFRISRGSTISYYLLILVIIVVTIYFKILTRKPKSKGTK